VISFIARSEQPIKLEMSAQSVKDELKLPALPGEAWSPVDRPGSTAPPVFTPLTAPIVPAAPFVADAPKLSKSAGASRPRNETIDVVRFFAAAGVVFVHSRYSATFDNWDNFFRFAVPFYLFASLYFQALSLRRNADRSLGEQVVGRFKRLYLPVLVWSVIYVLARDVKRMALLGLPAVQLNASMLWKGTEYHLWFLPFLLAMSLVQAALHLAFVRRDARWRWALASVMIAAGFAFGIAHMPAGWNETYDNPTYTYVQRWRALPSACWAMTFAWIMTAGPRVIAVPSIVGIAGLGLTLGCLLKQALQGLQTIPRAFTGLGCMLASLAPWSTSGVATLARLGRLGYGIYLSHVLIVESVRAITSRANLAPSGYLDVFTFALSFALALVFVRMLSRFRRLAWLNG
jgi:peptidoglycan/LPS O-acetylase OafA/YrhL